LKNLYTTPFNKESGGLDKKQVNDFIRKRVRDLRIQRGLELKQVAEKIGYDQSNLSKIERGDRYLVPVDMLIKLSKLYNVHLMYFFADFAEDPEELHSLGDKWISLINMLKDQNLTPEQVEQIIDTVTALKKL
jgi:transcriptional regulator with XRE-family HTH domain